MGKTLQRLKFLIFVCFCFTCISISFAFADTLISVAEDSYAEGEVFIVFDKDSDSSIAMELSDFASSVEASDVKSFENISNFTTKKMAHIVSSRLSTMELMEQAKQIPGVIKVFPNRIYEVSLGKTCSKNAKNKSSVEKNMLSLNEPQQRDDFIGPNDTYYIRSYMWNIPAIKMNEAWVHSIGSRQVFVAVMDSGVDTSHKDLAPNIGVDKDGNQGKDFTKDNNPSLDLEGHGTHVAGTIGAVGGNRIGIPGINWAVSILPVKVLWTAHSNSSEENRVFASTSSVIGGLEYILEQKKRGLDIKVVNCSFGGWYQYEGPETEELTPEGIAYRAVDSAGIIIVASSGNDGVNLDNPFGSREGKQIFPAGMQTLRNKISVASINEDFKNSDFSNYSSRLVDLSAPGEEIWSCIPGDGYENWEGTSMAAPHVTGAVALLAERYPSWTAKELKDRILSTVNVSTNLTNLTGTSGILNVFEALNVPLGDRPVEMLEMEDVLNLPRLSEWKLNVRVFPDDARNRNLLWRTSNNSIATIMPSGKIKGLLEGTVFIYCASAEDTTKTAACVLTVEGEGEKPPQVIDEFQMGGCNIAITAGTSGWSVFLLLSAVLMLFSKK